MPTHAPLVILLTHNAWANRRILDACVKLTDDQFHQRFDTGRGSLHDTITHIAGSMRAWTDFLGGREQRPRLEHEGRRSPRALIELHDHVAAELDAAAKAGELDATLTNERNGRTHTLTRGAVLTHVTTHGVHHRAQCLYMLRGLGADLPEIDVIDWAMTIDGQG